MGAYTVGPHSVFYSCKIKWESDLPVCHFLPIPAEGVVRWSRLTAAQCLPKTTVEGAEALQVGHELPEVGKDGEGLTQKETKYKTSGTDFDSSRKTDKEEEPEIKLEKELSLITVK